MFVSPTTHNSHSPPAFHVYILYLDKNLQMAHYIIQKLSSPSIFGGQACEILKPFQMTFEMESQYSLYLKKLMKYSFIHFEFVIR